MTMTPDRTITQLQQVIGALRDLPAGVCVLSAIVSASDGCEIHIGTSPWIDGDDMIDKLHQLLGDDATAHALGRDRWVQHSWTVDGVRVFALANTQRSLPAPAPDTAAALVF